jgi:hypothetical protein
MHLDLFEHPELIPTHVQSILDKHSGMDCTYGDCDKLVADLNAVGYDCDFDLNAELYNLRKVEDKEIDRMNFLELEQTIDECQRLCSYYEKKAQDGQGNLSELIKYGIAVSTKTAAKHRIDHLKWILNREPNY